MKKISILTLMIVLLSVLIFGGCGKPTAPEKFNLRFSTVFPEVTSVYQLVMKPVLDEIKEKSTGRITFTLFTGAELGGVDHDNVRTGKSDISCFATGYTPGRFPLSDIFTLPAAYETSEAMVAVALAVYDRMLNKEFTDVRGLGTFRVQDSYLYSTKPVRVLEDMKGLKVRTATALDTEATKALGATPVQMPLTDLYLAVQTGTVDGAITAGSVVLSFKLNEVFKHVLKFNFGSTTWAWVINLETWEKMPDDLKSIIETATRKGGLSQPKLQAMDDPKATKALEDAGGSSYTLPSNEERRWIDVLQPSVKKWVAALEAKGLPGQELMDITREECQKMNVRFPY